MFLCFQRLFACSDKPFNNLPFVLTQTSHAPITLIMFHLYRKLGSPTRTLAENAKNTTCIAFRTIWEEQGGYAFNPMNENISLPEPQ